MSRRGMVTRMMALVLALSLASAPVSLAAPGCRSQCCCSPAPAADLASRVKPHLSLDLSVVAGMTGHRAPAPRRGCCQGQKLFDCPVASWLALAEIPAVVPATAHLASLPGPVAGSVPGETLAPVKATPAKAEAIGLAPSRCGPRFLLNHSWLC